MNTEIKSSSLTKKSGPKTILAAFNIIKAADGNLPRRDVLAAIRNSVEMTPWEQQIYEKTGNIRWESIFHFYSITCIKAGFQLKNKGVWYLTEEGEKEIPKGGGQLLEDADGGYKTWNTNNKLGKNESTKTVVFIPEIEESPASQIKANFDLVEEQALAGIKEFIRAKTLYEFHDLAAALLRAMKYHTPFIYPKGKDGKLDIVAYNDPLGASVPRFKVQVKHRPDISVPVDDIRSLTGLLNKDGDVGLFVTSGTFTSESERFARESHRHIRLIGHCRFYFPLAGVLPPTD